MRLKELLTTFVEDTALVGTENVCVNLVCTDSRDIVDGSVFFALQGINSHGLDHLTAEHMTQLGAIVYEPTKQLPPSVLASGTICVAVEALSEKMSAIAARVYDYPSLKCQVVGVTGTNGKTSCTHFIAKLLDGAVIGTMGYGKPDTLNTLSHTTPEPLLVQKLLAELSESVDNVSMEVSSHGLSLHRVEGVDFHTVVFTNLSLDHLDFYKSMGDYVAAKKRLFSDFSAKFAVINADDEHAQDFANTARDNDQTVLFFGKSEAVERETHYLYYQKLGADAKGMTMAVNFNLLGQQGQLTLKTQLWGEFNLANICTAILVGLSLGHDIFALCERAHGLTGVLGRISPIALPNGAVAVIDYAHTPDALQNVLQSVREHTNGRIICLFGCGGDRDTLKRPLMATIAETYADEVIVTDDNPRTEVAENIIADIMSGARQKGKFTTISGRERAIVAGLERLKLDDVLVVAGKGHEPYQIIGTEKHDFSDYDEVRHWAQRAQAEGQD